MANITRYNPFSEAISLRDAVDRLFEDSVVSPRFGGNTSGRTIAANLYETTEGFTLQLPIPGIKPEDVDITVQQNVISLKWKTDVQIPEGAHVHWNGFQSGQYQQSITVPTVINAERVEANYEKGILTLQLPKAEHAKARSIKVNEL
jgi:HSP20 family protein